jgi:quinol monooxygenase YgiN
MNIRQFLLLSASVFVGFSGGGALAQEMQEQYLQLAEIEVDAAQLESYKAAANEQIETAMQLEPGVLVFYSVSEKDSPTHIKVFEIYRDADAYQAHLQTAHFKKYKAATATMVKSLKLIRTIPIMLGAKPQ